jgi:1-acyl-sn-glycerol-3-phosphate acyltransferase
LSAAVKDKEQDLMDSMMEFLAGRRANNDEALLPFSAPTYEQVRRFFGNLVRAMYRLEVVGADRIPVSGPIVVAPNHDSVLDGIVLGAAISRELRFVAKAELWQSRLLAWALNGLGVIRIKHGRSDHRALAQVRHALDVGQAVAIFPQGAVRGDRVWHRGAARVALVTGAPLVPVRLIGTAQALSRGRILFPRLRVIVGEPIEVARAPEDPVAAQPTARRSNLCANLRAISSLP